MIHVASTSPRRQHSQTIKSLVKTWLSDPSMSQRDFCARHNISYATFHYHLGKHRRQTDSFLERTKARFIPLALPELPIRENSPIACELSLPDGLVIRFESIPAADYLSQLIQAMSGRS